MITVVSGLPRSGTSMMMQMLEAGGMEIMTDKIRTADEDNPKGYYELEAVKQSEDDTSWLDGADGKVVKAISMLLYDLPLDRDYKVIFMIRDLGEVLASQAKMLERRGEDPGPADDVMKGHFRKHVTKTLDWMTAQDRVEFVLCNYRESVADPETAAAKIAGFLDAGLDVRAMAESVQPDLYRNRV